jgi:L-alanine-DL-glutamate epimerase-like enolase superfamily enzyme
MPGLLALRIHTDAGTVDGVPVIGHGETYYIPTAAAAVIHDFFAPRLLGSSATAIESHWRFLYERMTAFGGWGAESGNCWVDPSGIPSPFTTAVADHPTDAPTAKCPLRPAGLDMATPDNPDPWKTTGPA